MSAAQDDSRVVRANTAEFRAGDELPAGPGPASGQGGSVAQPLDEVENAQAAARVRSGANWFYWVAGMSALNSVASLMGTGWRFILGLGVTQGVDALAYEMGATGRVIALLANAVPLAFFAAMGYFAHRGLRWAFILGMLAFALDGVIVLVLQDWIGAAFHAFALYRMYDGLRHVGQLRATPEEPQAGG